MKMVTDLDLRPYLGHPGEFVVLRDYVGEHNGETFRVPRGFITDLASKPLLNRNDRSIWDAVFHDWNYCIQSITREEADQIFYEGLLERGMPKAQALLYHRLVRAWGWRYWNRRKKQPINRSYDFVPPGYWEAHP